jgi:hypothetical protein
VRTPKAGGPVWTLENTWVGVFNQVRLDRVYENGVQRHRFAYDALTLLGYTQHQDPARGVAYNFYDGDDEPTLSPSAPAQLVCQPP